MPYTQTPFDLTGRVALITGGGVGIGAAGARILSRAGARVAIHCHTSRSDADALLAEITQAGGEGLVVQGDLAEPETGARLVAETIARWGRLDILFNNAGAPLARSSIENCPPELWRQAFDVNLHSAFEVTRAAIPHQRGSGHGSIINNLSLSVQTGGSGGAGPYAAAKGALLVFTRTLSRELAPEVRANCIMPGVVETRHHERFSTPEKMADYRRQTPLGRNSTAEEIGGSILFLASDASSFMTGALLDLNGGRFLR
jgi:3-oxoacyl-[acyl-carrier protein] reductase